MLTQHLLKGLKTIKTMAEVYNSKLPDMAAMRRNSPMMPAKMGVGMGKGQGLMKRSMKKPPVLGSMKKGGKIKKTGLYRLHKGEKVVPSKKKK